MRRLGSARAWKILRRLLPGRGLGHATIAIAECRFRDEAAMRAALASPATPEVVADIPRFTEATPRQSLAGPV